MRQGTCASCLTAPDAKGSGRRGGKRLAALRTMIPLPVLLFALGAAPATPSPIDSLAGFVPPSPLPDPVAAVFRFLFQVPQWIQIAGFFLGLAVSTVAIVHIVRRRRAILGWFASRTPATRWTMAGATALVLGGATWGGERTWNYMQHDNDFCMTCHVMETPFQRFTVSAHHDLSCHDCHQQSIFASTRQMVLWVAERPVDIREHAPVPNARCESCHVTGEPENWQRIRETAGHKLHLDSKNPALAGIQCVDCHGVEVHRFTPVDATCGTMGCHDKVSIQLGEMANQTSLHCTACHRFTADVGANADSAEAARAIGPRLEQCNSCHQMQSMIADFDPARDPHSAECGTCHNPHVQKEAKEAGLRCVVCHDDWRSQPFHVGPVHANVAESCTMCHAPHQARVDASDCTGCHRAVAAKPGVSPEIVRKLKAALPMEVGAARGDPSPPQESGPFSHSIHASLQCSRCHDPGASRGVVSFAIPVGCNECHHGASSSAAAAGPQGCATCHDGTELARPREVSMRVAVADHAARARPVRFNHPVHAALACDACHSQSATRAVRAEAGACIDCHADHHTADRSCAECHSGTEVGGAHKKLPDAHVSCDACHDHATVAAVTPDRSFCIMCHTDRTTHYADGSDACASCHFLSTPAQLRSRLTSATP